MEFNFDLACILPGKITVIESAESFSGLQVFDLKSSHDSSEKSCNTWTYNLSSNNPWDLKLKKRKEDLENVIDKIGLASAQAQNLNSRITSLKKLISSSRQKLYVIRDVAEHTSIIGMLKVGIKRLFVEDGYGANHEVDPLCILDFYVHESKQRCGYGHALFNAMLDAEQTSPEKLAIDRPSSKCLAFMKKHYNLKDPSRQNNYYVVYPGFFTDQTEKCASKESTRKLSELENSLHTVPVLFSPRDIKSKTYSSSAENCLNWNNSERDTNHYRQTKPESSKASLPKCKGSLVYETENSEKNTPVHISLDKQYHNWQKSNCMNWNKREKNWGVYDAMHSYPPTGCNSSSLKYSSNLAENKNLVSDNESTEYATTDKWNHSYSALAPVCTSSQSPQMKWNQGQSSWNIFGVRPQSFSLIQKKM